MKKQILLTIPHMRVVNILEGNIKTEVYNQIPKNFVGGLVNICDGDKIVARFTFRYTRIPVKYTTFNGKEWTFDTRALNLLTPHILNIRKSVDELSRYAKGQDLYLWHIDNLEKFTTHKTLDVFTKPKKENYDGMIDWDGSIYTPPQTWQFVMELEDEDETTTS